MGVDPSEGITEDGHGVEIESVGARHAEENACPKYRISSVGGAPGTIRLASALFLPEVTGNTENETESERGWNVTENVKENETVNGTETSTN